MSLLWKVVLVVNVEKVKLSMLKTQINSVKHHNRKNIDAIKNNIKKFNQYAPLVVNKNNFEILKGAGTYTAMKQLNIDQCYVYFVDLDDKKQNQLIVLDNRTSQLSQLDNIAVQKLLYDLQKNDALFTGFSQKQIQNIMNSQTTTKQKQDLTQKVNLVKIKCPYCGTQFSQK